MPMNLDAVGAVSKPGRISWTSKDALLYALGVGAGQIDPTGFELEFTTENSQNVAAAGAADDAGRHRRWAAARACRAGASSTSAMLLHGEQGVTVHGPIPPDGEVESVTKIVGIYDKGKAAVVRLETESTYVDSGKPAFTTRFAAFIRGEGGFGESRGAEIADPPKMPDRKRRPRGDVRDACPTRRCSTASRATATRCTPIPTLAKFAGFDRPILHGLCTYGVTGRALLHELCGSDVAQVREHGRALLQAGLPGRHAHRADVGRRHGHGASSRPSTRKASS